MVQIEAYHRKQTIPEMAGIYFFVCVDCKKQAEVFETERKRDKDANKYLASGLCPRCFEVAVEAKLRAFAPGG